MILYCSAAKNEMEKKNVSFIIPTLNARKTIGQCLLSIIGQEYPEGRFEIVIADGGSRDGTLELLEALKEILPKGTLKVVENPGKTSEAGKAVGLKTCTYDYAAFVDADNVLPDRDWLKKHMEPFEEGVHGSEPLYFSCRDSDGCLDRYFAMLGMNDPLCLFLGNYDRYSCVSGKWTSLKVRQEDRGDYFIVDLHPHQVPTMGANGFIVRRDALEGIDVDDYYFDMDVVYSLVQKGRTRFAKVKRGIVHLYSNDLRTFLKKQRRRIQDYLFYSRLKRRRGVSVFSYRNRILLFSMCCLTLFPLLLQAYSGYRRMPDRAWWIHPLACILTFFVYAYYSLKGMLRGVSMMDREGW